MSKFDKTCGLSQEQIRIIKVRIKEEISKYLPLMPDPIEMKLFFEGREAWIYNWNLIKKQIIKSKFELSLEVLVKLKKEFHKSIELKQVSFLFSVHSQKDIYYPKLSIIKKEPNIAIELDF